MLLVLAQANVKWFVLPIVVHQAYNFSHYIYFNIPLEWIFHHPPSRYNHLITLITEYFISTKSSICHLYQVSPLNRPFKVTMTWDFSFFSLFPKFLVFMLWMWVKLLLPVILYINLSPQLPSNMISPFSGFLPPFFTLCPIPPIEPSPSHELLQNHVSW